MPLRSFPRARMRLAGAQLPRSSAAEVELDAIACRAQEVLQARAGVPVLVDHFDGAVEIAVGLRLRRTFPLSCQMQLYKRIRAGEDRRRDHDGRQTKLHISRFDSAPREGRRRTASRTSAALPGICKLKSTTDCTRRRRSRRRRQAAPSTPVSSDAARAPADGDDEAGDRDQNRRAEQEPTLDRELQVVVVRFPQVMRRNDGGVEERRDAVGVQARSRAPEIREPSTWRRARSGCGR